jgi:hypothetical protein
VKTAIAETGHINMLSWAESRASGAAESVDAIRERSLLSDCQTTTCIGGLACYLATSDEIARVAEIYGLPTDEIQDPELIGATLLLDGIEDKYEWRDAEGNWFCSHGNEHWEFDDEGLMRRRDASINDISIQESERRYFE